MEVLRGDFPPDSTQSQKACVSSVSRECFLPSALPTEIPALFKGLCTDILPCSSLVFPAPSAGQLPGL